MEDRTVLRAERVVAPVEAPPAAQPRRPRRAPWASAKVLLGRMAGWWGAFAAPVIDLIRPHFRRAMAALAVVSGLGWSVVVLALLAWVVAVRLGWLEFAYLSAVLLLVFALSLLFTVGRLRLDVDLDLEPRRVSVGESAAAQLHVVNEASAPLLPLGLELPVGQAVARYTLPLLAPKADHTEIALIPTQRRGVVLVGPVTTQRGDPFGVARREVNWTEQLEMFIHPPTVALEPLGSGLLRDLEGHTTNDVSMSDLAFHTLREYVPGDDRRYIHWRSSAKLSSASGAGTFLVRQFLDTRRSHVAVVVDVNPASYGSEADFEMAISAGASVAVRALIDEMDLTVVCGDHVAVQPPVFGALDTFSRAELGERSLAASAGQVQRLAPDVSVVVLFTGSQATVTEFQQARSYLSREVNTLVVQAHGGSAMSLRELGGMRVLGIGDLSDLPRVLSGGSVQ